MNLKAAASALAVLALRGAFAQPPAPTEQSRTFSLTNTPDDRGVQEILTTLRTVAGLAQVSASGMSGGSTSGAATPSATPPGTITAAGTSGQLALADWLVPLLDRPAGRQASVTFQMPGATDEVALVSYLAHSDSVIGIQEILTTLRTVLDVQKIFQNSARNAIILRGTTDRVAVAEWLIRELDRDPKEALPSGPHRSQVFGGSDDILQVIYLAGGKAVPRASLQQALTSLRINQRFQRIYQNSASGALVLRGGSAQIAQAQEYLDGLTRERN